MPPDSISDSHLQRSKLSSSCSEVWLRPCFTVASTFASNPSWFNWAVFLGQTLATLGEDVAPNRCFTIRYSCISFARSLFGYHKNLLRFKKCRNLLGPPWIGETLLLCHQLLVIFVQTLLHNHEPASPLPLRDALLGSEGGTTLVYPLCSTLLQELFLHVCFLCSRRWS